MDDASFFPFLLYFFVEQIASHAIYTSDKKQKSKEHTQDNNTTRNLLKGEKTATANVNITEMWLKDTH